MPALRALRNKYPTAYIAWVVEGNAQDILQGQPDLARLFIFKGKKWTEEIFSIRNFLNPFKEVTAFFREIREKQFDLLLDFRGILKSGVIGFFSSVPLRAGFRILDQCRVVNNMERPPISACIITFNEEKNIRDCLESITWVEDIVIVDSLSQDNTVNICREYTNRVFQKEWPGHVKQKNCALDHAKNEWVLCLDADERISPELREEIESHLSKDDKGCDGYLFPRHSFYLGRWINHCGWYPDNKLRLFKKSKGRWGGNDPHDKVILQGATKKLSGELLHFVYKNLSHQLQTVDSFSTITAKVLESESKKFSLFKLLFRPPFKFFGVYVIKKGFMDGLPGFIIAVSSSFYVFLKYAKLWELGKHKSESLTNR